MIGLKNRSLRLFFLVAAAILLCGCAKGPGVHDPQIPYGLLIKSRDFLAFCVFLADQEKPYYNHIAQRYYYAMLALASISYQWSKGHGTEYKVISKHDDVWKLMPHDVKKTYGEDLKGLRTQCDYHYEESARDMGYFRQGLLSVLKEKERVFPQLESKVRTDYTKFFGKKVMDESINTSDLNTLMEDIKELDERFNKKLA